MQPINEHINRLKNFEPNLKIINTMKLRVGNKTIEVTPLSQDKVTKADNRIQKKVQPLFAKIKRTRSLAKITASKIIINT